jgi:hypothetical protein
MHLNVIVDDQTFNITVPEFILAEGEEYFRKLDDELDRGYQMSRTWIEKPDTMQRCQIAADKLLTALHHDRKQLGEMMAGYILTRMPGVQQVKMDMSGDMLLHEFS